VDDPREHGGRRTPSFTRRSSTGSYCSTTPVAGRSTTIGAAAVKLARSCRNESVLNAFVAGFIVRDLSLSNSPDAETPGFRVVNFAGESAYAQQCAPSSPGALTCFWSRHLRSLQRQGSLVASREGLRQDGSQSLMISAAVGRGGETRILRADHTEAFWKRQSST